MFLTRFLPIAWRNLARNRRRTAFTFAAISVGVAMIVFLDGVNRGVNKMLIDGIVHSQVGDLKVYPKGYLAQAKSGRLLHLSFPYTPELMRRVRAVDGVRAASGRIVFRGIITNGSGQAQVYLLGVDPEHENEVCYESGRQLRAGTAPLAPGDDDRLILGAQLAMKLFGRDDESDDERAKDALYEPEPPPVADVGSLTLLASSAKGRSSSIELKLKGYTSKLHQQSIEMVTLPMAQRLLDMPGAVTELTVAVTSQQRLEQVRDALQAALGPSYEVHAWRQLVPEIADMEARQAVVLGIVIFLLVSLVVFGIANTMLMCVRERTREIGTMGAVGTRPSQVMLIFAEEAVMLGIIGGTFGVGMGTTLCLWFERVGIPLGSKSPIFAGGLRPDWNPSAPWVLIIGAALISLLAGLVPAWKAARMKPIDALGQV